MSGSRADYGPARRCLQAVQAAPELELQVLATGMHLDPLHGETWREIEADGFHIAARVGGREAGDSLAAMSASVGSFLHGMSLAIERIAPEVVLVLGDRGEALAGAMAGAFQNRAVVHLCGGSLSGSIDDSIRHAITKFAHYHLPAFDEHARRIVQMGEDPASVRVVGLPGADLRPDVALSADEVKAALGLPGGKPYLLVVQHSVTHSQGDAAAQIVETLEGVLQAGVPALLANPNDDAGGREILRVMHEYAARHPALRILEPPRSRERFVSIMAHAAALVGNSSSGMVEALSIPVPVVNVGDRQRGREHLSCALHVGYERGQVARAVHAALHDPAYRERLRRAHEERGALDTPSLVAAFLRDLDPAAGRRPKPFFDSPERGTREGT